MENAESNTGGTPGVYHTDGADCPFWLVFFRSLPSPSPLRNYYEEGGGVRVRFTREDSRLREFRTGMTT